MNRGKEEKEIREGKSDGCLCERKMLTHLESDAYRHSSFLVMTPLMINVGGDVSSDLERCFTLC